MKLYTQQFDTPSGDMIVAITEDDVVTRLVFPNEHERWAAEISAKKHSIIANSPRCDFVVAQLDEYFGGKRSTFTLTVRPDGTLFQRQVWSALQTIPYGATITYKELAERIGNPAAVRAVGRANGTNPIPIIIPCHRVIGADGSLTGFGGGLALKEALLRLEGADVAQLKVGIEQLALL
jgi:methylated-DNA-[protein]-cysteine S-methyltransferase